MEVGFRTQPWWSSLMFSVLAACRITFLCLLQSSGLRKLYGALPGPPTATLTTTVEAGSMSVSARSLQLRADSPCLDSAIFLSFPDLGLLWQCGASRASRSPVFTRLVHPPNTRGLSWPTGVETGGKKLPLSFPGETVMRCGPWCFPVLVFPPSSFHPCRSLGFSQINYLLASFCLRICFWGRPGEDKALIRNNQFPKG